MKHNSKPKMFIGSTWTSFIMYRLMITDERLRTLLDHIKYLQRFVKLSSQPEVYISLLTLLIRDHN